MRKGSKCSKPCFNDLQSLSGHYPKPTGSQSKQETSCIVIKVSFSGHTAGEVKDLIGVGKGGKKGSALNTSFDF